MLIPQFLLLGALGYLDAVEQTVAKIPSLDEKASKCEIM
jgi:hypothetical protein